MLSLRICQSYFKKAPLPIIEHVILSHFILTSVISIATSFNIISEMYLFDLKGRILLLTVKN